MDWHIYIVECKDGVLYTGITNNLDRRVREHSSGNGCRFTKYRAPVKLMYSEVRPDRPQALQREAQIKRFPRGKKLELIKSIVRKDGVSRRRKRGL